MNVIVTAMLAWNGACVAQASADSINVKTDLKLEHGAIITSPLVIEADGITIDGNGATLQGPGKEGDIKSLAQAGVGILASGHSNITIRNITVRGFDIGLRASDGRNWLIEDSDFSHNYHDPEFGWGDGRRNGGIILTRIHESKIRRNKANHVWNGLDLWECDDNEITNNNFSHCSNVCLKMWTACRNTVTNNNLSYGLRIRPGEVHARDSTSVLMESGSNDNRYERNDITHGGDGVFIRVLNGWCSTGNVFIENDCSYANNNGFEAWSPNNTYIRNKANHCSYGFWLGGSDHTVLIGNEAAHNGLPTGFHNAPESDFVHGGIVIVHGSGSHSIIEGNHCHHNNGAGIVFRGDLGSKGEKWKMYHMIVQNNKLEHNRWGLFMRFSDWVYLSGNVYEHNQQDELVEDVSRLVRAEADPENRPPPDAKLNGPTRVEVGEKVVFDASESADPSGLPLKFAWDVGDQRKSKARVRHVFKKPGFNRVAVTVSNGYLADLAFLDVYVVDTPKEFCTEQHASDWGWTMGNNRDQRGRVKIHDVDTCLIGDHSVRLRPDPYKGHDVSVIYPADKKANWNLENKRALNFWIKFRNPNFGFQGPNPIVRLHGRKAALTYTPAFNGMPRNLFGDLPYSEARYGWLRLEIPLEGGDAWLRSETFEGGRPPHINNNLEFVTLSTDIATQRTSSMASDGRYAYIATIEGDRLLRSRNGREWEALKGPRHDLEGAHAVWINGMLAFTKHGGKKGRLMLRCRHPEKDEHGRDQDRLVAYDIARNRWKWMPTNALAGHGSVVVDNHLYGLGHAIMGNYGGPVCRVNLKRPGPRGERTVLGDVKGSNAAWFSRAAQMAEVDGKIYVIKNDWETPQPKEEDKVGDRLMVFEPKKFAVSDYAGGDIWDSKQWKAAHTPSKDLGALPFEVGHGASLVALPPKWCVGVGNKGGLFMTAGCSPSNHEGYGQPSNKYALFDIATKKFVTGVLPAPTGQATSAVLHKGKLLIKRGGVNYGPSNQEMWIVRPISKKKAKEASKQIARESVDLGDIDYLSIQFDSMGFEPFDIWIDGLAFE